MRIYVAGPYTKGDPVVNVATAIDAGDELANMGHYPYIPHLSMFWHYRHSHEYNFWLDQDKAWLTCCNALLRLPGESSGADKEVALAQELGIPVYYSVEEVFEASILTIYDGRTCREMKKDGECPLTVLKEDAS